MRWILTISLALMFGCGGEETTGESGNEDGSEDGSENSSENGNDGVDLGNGDTSMPGDPVAGAEVFATTCQACHGADGRGNGGLTAADFNIEPERLLKGNDILLREIAEGISNGARVMPPHQDTLTEQQRKDALSYVRQQWGSDS